MNASAQPQKTAVARSPWGAIRALLDARDFAMSSWRNVLNDLAAHSEARGSVSNLNGGGDLNRARRQGNVVTSDDGLRFVAIGREHPRMEWTGLSPPGTIVLNMVCELSQHLEDNFLVRIGADPRSGLRFSNHSITHIGSASVLRRDNSQPFLLSWAVDSTYSSLFVDGELKLRKRRTETGPFDRLVMELVGDKGADTEAMIRAFELRELSPGRPLEGFLHQSEQELTEETTALMRGRDLSAVAAMLNRFDGIDLAPVTDEAIALLDHVLDIEHGYRDWVFDLVLAALPKQVAADWRATRAARIPEPLVSVKDLSVRFHRNPTVRFALSRLLRRGEDDAFDVLRDVNLEVYPGEVFGIVGANGAGKSTLLKVLTGLIPIRTGEIALRSQPLLLSPGLGIRDELSGRENIYLACCFMGMSIDETRRIYQDIVEFSELSEFIEQPFKFYSDGMKSRLVFSIATAVAPDLIMLDELLNAGDIKFQRKAARRLDEMITRTKAVIVVTHSIQFVLHRCTKAVLIDHGRQLAYGSPDVVVSRYLDLLQMSGPAQLTDESREDGGFGPTVD